MSANTKRVFYVRNLADPVFADILGRRDDLKLDRLENENPDDLADPILAAAHVYQVGSTRDEIARKFHVDAASIARMPQVLVVSTNGVGYDTVDVDACTAAGILVVNQAGGNREAVAEHALGMLIALSKRIPETNHAMRREPRINRVAYMGNDVFGKTIGIVGLGPCGQPPRPALPRPVRNAGAGLRSLSLGGGLCRPRRRKGRARRTDAPQRLRLDQLPAHDGDSVV